MADHLERPDPLDEHLRRSARTFQPPAATPPLLVGGHGIDEVLVRSAARRRARVAARATAGMVAIIGVLGVVRLPSTSRADLGTDGTAPHQTATTSARSAPVATEPAPGGSTPGPTVGTVPATTTTMPVAPGAAVTSTTVGQPTGGTIEVRSDGLGLVSFGQDYDSALLALTAAFGSPDASTLLGDRYATCTVRSTRDVRWDDLTVSFVDTGSGLKLAGYFWGNISHRNTANHPPPQGPASPPLRNPWGLQIGTVVPSLDALLTQVLGIFPRASFGDNAGLGLDPAISTQLGDHQLHIVFDLVPGTGYVVDSIWTVKTTCGG